MSRSNSVSNSVPDLHIRHQVVLPGGRNWVRTSDPSLVRRNRARITPSSPGRSMHLNCENHVRRCPKMPGRVCRVVPASGSRSSLLTPRSKSELQPGGGLPESHLPDGRPGVPSWRSAWAVTMTRVNMVTGSRILVRVTGTTRSISRSLPLCGSTAQRSHAHISQLWCAAPGPLSRVSADFHATGSAQGSGELVAEGPVAPPGNGGGGRQVGLAQDG